MEKWGPGAQRALERAALALWFAMIAFLLFETLRAQVV